MPLTFRTAVAVDAADVLAFWGRAAEDAHRPGDSAGAVERLIERDPTALLLAMDGTEIVGTVVAGWDGWRCRILTCRRTC